MDGPESPVSVYYQESLVGQGLGSHIHQCHELILVTGGSAEFTINGRPYLAQAGSLVVIGYLEKHEVRIVRYPYQRYVLSLTNDFCLLAIQDLTILSILIHRPEQFTHVLPLADDLARQLARLFAELAAEYAARQAFWMTRAAARVQDILIELYRSNPRLFPISQETARTRTVIEVQKDIARHFMENISLESLAARHFVSRCHLSRIFGEVTGYHFKDYLILYRVAKARELLRHTDRSVIDVGIAVGYGNVNHFIRIFHQQEGATPLQYRKQPQTIDIVQ